MRALLFHCKEYETKIGRLATRPAHLVPEKIKERKQRCEDCIVAFITVEKDGNVQAASLALANEIAKMSEQAGYKKIVLVPFVHLSNNIAGTKESFQALNWVEQQLQERFRVMRAHFGSHKSLLLNVYGHPGNVRYREF